MRGVRGKRRRWRRRWRKKWRCQKGKIMCKQGESGHYLKNQEYSSNGEEEEKEAEGIQNGMWM